MVIDLGLLWFGFGPFCGPCYVAGLGKHMDNRLPAKAANGMSKHFVFFSLTFFLKNRVQIRGLAHIFINTHILSLGASMRNGSSIF